MVDQREEITSDSKNKKPPQPENLDFHEVYVCFDTNIYLRNMKKTKYLDVIKRFQKLPNLKILLPEIVSREFERHLSKWELKTTKGAWIFTDGIDSHINAYIDRHIKKLKGMCIFKPLSSEATKKATLRMIDHIAPAGEKQQAKDAVLWEDLLEFSDSERLILFATENGKDFYDHDSLIKEGSEHNIYFSRSMDELNDFLDDFIVERIKLEENIEISKSEIEEEYLSDIPDDINAHTQLTDCIYSKIVEDKYYFDADLEIETNNVKREIDEIRRDKETFQTIEVDINEEWNFDFWFACNSNIRLGGNDGIDISKSGHETGHGTLYVQRTITFKPGEQGVICDELDEPNMDLIYNGDFDPDDPTEAFWEDDDHDGIASVNYPEFKKL